MSLGKHLQRHLGLVLGEGTEKQLQVQPVLLQELGKSDSAEAVVTQISKQLQSEKFVSELEETVGEPRDGESEDAFTKRACAGLRNVLYRLLR